MPSNPPPTPTGPPQIYAGNTLAQRPTAERDWYSVSVDSMKRAVLLLLAVIALIASAFVYQQWRQLAQKGQAERLITDASDLARQVEERNDAAQLRREFFEAWDNLEAARLRFAEERFGDALSLGTRSLLEFQQILQADTAEVKGRGRFLDVQGQVEYRRGDRGAWRRARDQDVVNPGDTVRTSAGSSAKILFPEDGSEFVLSPSTYLVHTVEVDRFGRSEQVPKMEFGTVDFSSGQGSIRVKTPKAEANVRKSSEGMVAFDRERSATKFASYQGSIDVIAANGQTQTLATLQQVEQVGDLLQEPTILPDRPQLAFPADEREIDLQSNELRLSWRPINGAVGYTLNVSENKLFVSNLIERSNLTNATARIGLKGEGLFYWQVAAVDRAGVRGPWSETRSFRIVRRSNERDDKTPPILEVEAVDTYGSLLVVSGRTEPGSKVTVNGESASLGSDGRFSKSLSMKQGGFLFVEILATDAVGNVSREQRRIFFDATY